MNFIQAPQHLYLCCEIRKLPTHSTADVYNIAFPLTRAWFDGTEKDLHIQFAARDGINILPTDNSEDEIWVIPEEAKILRRWLKDNDYDLDGAIGITHSMLYVTTPDLEIIPPISVIRDLVDHWSSPNR